MMIQLRRINVIHFLADCFILVVAGILSVYAANFSPLDTYKISLIPAVAVFLTVKLCALTFSGVTYMVWRYFSVPDSVRIVKAMGVCFVLCVFFMVFMVERPPGALRFLFIDFFLGTSLLCGGRLWRRVYTEKLNPGVTNRRRTLICGAGNIGRSLIQRFQRDSSLGFQIVGFIDDADDKIGRFISGSRVIGRTKDLERLIKELSIEEVIIAIGAPEGALVRQIFEQCLKHQIRPRTVSRMTRLSVTAPIKTLRELELSDLLFRPQQNLNLETLMDFIKVRTVLITGAGGSIGSELARQVHSLKPKKLILLDHSEFNLFNIDREVRGESQTAQTISILGDIKDVSTLENVFQTYRPDIVLHAAAYKHVHLVESNPHAAFLNNVLGTKNLADLSSKYQVKNFVLISSDKAVNPAGFMGATKRVCELIIAQKSLASTVRFCAVRFGNVLGSSGSLVPLLQKQIDNGEAITLTHPDMARYFMLIPEAVSLVLTAATLSTNGDIMILKMGQPVKIIDLTRSLIALNKKKEADVPIIYTGIRPGEKLVEELYLCGNEIETSHSEILVAPKGDSRGTSRERFWQDLDQTLNLAKENSPALVNKVKALIMNDNVETQNMVRSPSAESLVTIP
jgi:FlaA1/EpsC-like NDP-sugar epimerase